MELNNIERKVIDLFRENQRIPDNMEPVEKNILMAMLHVALIAGRKLRKARNRIDELLVEYKNDGSVVTEIDRNIEKLARKIILKAFPDFGFIGEETGGRLDAGLTTAAIDPIDGTWSFLTHDSTNALSLSLFANNKVICGIVLNPSTGEIGYAFETQPARLIQVSCFGEKDSARDLPSCQDTAGSKILVNIQPSKGFRKYDIALKKAWSEKQIDFVKCSGGSPSLALLEAAKGHYIYVHPWQASSTAYDLSGGMKLVENAGGKVTDISGKQINPVHHTGLFIAGVHSKKVAVVRQILGRKNSNIL